MVNVGHIDRIARFIVGAILVALPLLSPFDGFFAAWGNWKFAVAVVGAVAIGTALFRICPTYMLIGLRTCAIGKR